MRNLFAYLACIGVQVSEVLLDEILKQQNPHQQKRGGLGYGLHASVIEKNKLVSPPRGVNIRINPSSPLYLTKVDDDMGWYGIVDDEKVTATAIPFKPADWIGRRLANGRYVAEVIQQHTGRNLVGIIGGTRCPLFDSGNACAFCGMKGGVENLKRTTEEVLEALAIILEYRKDYVLTFTTPLMTDEVFENVCDSLARIKNAFPGIPLALESQPTHNKLVERIKSSGVDTWMVPLDCYNEPTQRLYIPGKHQILVDYYWDSLTHAVSLWGEGNVVSNIIVGLEDVWLTCAAITQMVSCGVIPDPIPIRPDERLKIETDPEAFVQVQTFLREEMNRSGLATRMSRVKSGCAACGGCGGGISANMLKVNKNS